MTRLFNDPTAFADDMIDGFVLANSRWVARAPGGVVRAGGTPDGTVAVVVGGGSGHYPAFGGLVGAGLAHGAAMGAVFASPSAQQVYSVASVAHAGAGVLLTYGNYAGDVLNFDQAQEQLRRDGVQVETVVVTDDICSAPQERSTDRRGIAGDLAVFKVAGAAADSGLPLGEVVRIATRANAMTRSIGVAFGGCTLPGAGAPLFDVRDGRMAVGLGIHGEPGVDETDLPTADGLAELLVDRVCAETPAGASARIAVILNGLGAVKYEELFVVYRGVARLLAERGLQIVDPEVGELCTSLDMAGVSLTLMWLDHELEQLWRAPADTPAFTKVEAVESTVAGSLSPNTTTASAVAVGPASDASRVVAHALVRALDAVAVAIVDNEDHLGRLDAVAGDGDHGSGMRRGATAALAAARAAADRGSGAHSVLKAAGLAWADRAGGTSGAIWGAMLGAAADRLGDDVGIDARTVAAAAVDALDATQRLGHANVGDKTMVDALAPFAATLSSEVDADTPLGQAWKRAAAEATRAADDTASLVPHLGRARIHAERSLGNPDPGAVSLALVVTTSGNALMAQEFDP